MDKRISNAIAVLVSVVWALSFVVDIFSPAYDPSPFIHMAMMAVVGAAFGQTLLKKSEDKEKDQ